MLYAPAIFGPSSSRATRCRSSVEGSPSCPRAAYEMAFSPSVTPHRSTACARRARLTQLGRACSADQLRQPRFLTTLIVVQRRLFTEAAETRGADRTVVECVKGTGPDRPPIVARAPCEQAGIGEQKMS
eukprot:6201294-Pleurochrysis_carterae.AAC.3